MTTAWDSAAYWREQELVRRRAAALSDSLYAALRCCGPVSTRLGNALVWLVAAHINTTGRDPSLGDLFVYAASKQALRVKGWGPKTCSEMLRLSGGANPSRVEAIAAIAEIVNR